MSTLARPDVRSPAPPSARTNVRRRWRRRLLLAGLLPLLFILLFAVKVGTMVLAQHQGGAHYAAGDFADARDAFRINRTLNVIETWIAPYDEGSARYRLGDFAGAVRASDESLAFVPSEEECRVRINLALSHEAVGDSAAADGAVATAQAEWSLGIDVLSAGDCLLVVPARSGPSAAALRGARSDDEAADARSIDERLRSKLPPGTHVDPADASGEATDDEALRERNERAKKIRRRAEQRQEDQQSAPQATPSPSPSAPTSPSDAPSPHPPPPTYQW